MQWTLKDARENGEDYCVSRGERQIENPVLVRQALWETHMESPTVALEEVQRRTENGAGRTQSCGAGDSET